MKHYKATVFCGSSTGFNSLYSNKAKALADYFCNHNIDLIYGAGKIGLMGIVADTMLKQGGKVIGVIPDLLQKEEVVHNNVTELIVTKTMSERKVIMSKLTDFYITLPGGFGTLDEIFEVLTLQQLHIEHKPVALLNPNNFFDGLLQQLDKMVDEGFLNPKNRRMLLVDDTIEGLMQKVFNYKAPQQTSVINKVVS